VPVTVRADAHGAVVEPLAKKDGSVPNLVIPGVLTSVPVESAYGATAMNTLYYSARVLTGACTAWRVCEV